MGRELTRRHFSLFENKLKNPFGFLRDVYQYEKYRELSSFVIWELLHQCGLFPKKQYLQFNNPQALVLKDERLPTAAFDRRLGEYFQQFGLQAERSPHPWKALFVTAGGEMYGSLYPHDRDLYQSVDQGKTTTFVSRFPESIKSIFVSSQQTLFVCAKGAVYRSCDHGHSFHKVLDMGTPESFFRHNNEVTETPDGMLIIGEYGNVWDETRWRQIAYLYFSVDNGATWERSDFLNARGTNKHVHLVKYSPALKQILMADGDNYKKFWISKTLALPELKQEQGWRLINPFHIQMGGYTAVVESAGKIFLGTDYQGGTNFLVTTTDGQHFDKAIVPDPYRRSPIDNMVLRQTQQGGTEIWANLPYSTSKTKCLLMYSADSGQSWNKMLEYKGSAYKAWLLNANQAMNPELYISIADLKTNDRVVYKLTDKA